jgi:AraC-like DNA-binding protein
LSVSIFITRAIVEAIEQTGVERARLLAEVPLEHERLADAHARLGLEEFGRLLTAGMTLTGDTAFGIHVVERMAYAAGNLLSDLVVTAPTVREALIACTQFRSLAVDGLSYEADEHRDTFVVRCTIPRSTPECDRVLAEMAMTGLVRLARALVSPHVVPLRASFEYERGSDLAEYRRVFGDVLRFEQRETSIVFDRAIADRPQVHQDRELYFLLHAEAERRRREIGAVARLTVRLNRYLHSMSPAQIPDMAVAARDLGMSERSLRRHLAAEGTSYRDLVRTALEASADRLLGASSSTLKEIAASLGFVDAAAFNRAFKRWTGVTPAEYRRRARA